MDSASPKQQPNQPTQSQQLEQQIAELTTQVKKQNSPWRALALGIFRGLGTAIGLVLISGLLFAFIGRSLSQIQSIDDIPVLNKLITNNELQELKDLPGEIPDTEDFNINPEDFQDSF